MDGRDAMDGLDALDPLDVLEAVVERLAHGDPSAYGDARSIERIERIRSQVEYIATEAVASFEQWGEWTDDGARSAAAWMATRCQIPRAEATRRLRRGRQLSDLPAARAAWATGALGPAHVDVVAALRTGRTEAALRRDEGWLVDQAQGLSFADFVAVTRYWESHADPDGVEEAARERRARRDASLVETTEGMWLGQMTLDPISGAIVAGEHHRLERALFEADWAQAKAELGRDPRVDELGRTAAQRRADALVEMATRSASAPADGRRPAPLFSVLVGYETLHGPVCQLAQGAVLTPGSLVPWLEQADIERAVFHPAGRVEVSATARLFSGATRRAIELRDRRCTHPYCDEPAERCQADHIVEYAAGGPTTQENGRLLCAFHHRLRSQGPPPDRHDE